MGASVDAHSPAAGEAIQALSQSGPKPQRERHDSSPYPGLDLDEFRARLLKQVIQAAAIVFAFYTLLVIFVAGPDAITLVFFSGTLICCYVSAVWLRRGKVRPAAWLFFVGVTGFSAFHNLLAGDRGGNLGYLVLAVLAAFIFGALGFYALAGASAAMLLVITALDAWHVLPPNHPQSLFFRWVAFCMATFVLARPVAYAVSTLTSALETAWRELRERRNAESALRESEHRFRAIIDSVNDAILVHDANSGVIVDLNPRTMEMFGYTREEMCRLSISELSVAESSYTQERALDLIRTAASGMPSVVEWHSRRKDGSDFWSEVSLRRADFDGVARVVVVVRDITERKAAEEARAKLEAELQHSQRLDSLGRLAGGVAHDFNNLLTVINGYAQLLLESQQSSRLQQEQLSWIVQAGTRASSLTTQLLAFARKQMVIPKPTDLNSIVLEVAEMLRGIIGDSIAVELRLGNELGRVMVDAGQVHQVLVNLAINARDAMPEGGRLVLESRNVTLDQAFCEGHPEVTSGDFVMLTVSDTGQGLDAVTRQSIFEPFFTTKPKGQASGLGLATVHGIVRQSRGCITLESEIGSGTAFHVYFPRYTETETSAPVEALTVRQAAASETLLVVEDRADVRGFIGSVLRDAGYRVLEAADGPAALGLADGHDGQIDALITDVDMPGMNGLELAKKLTAARPTMKVLFVSGYADDIVAQNGSIKPGISVLSKPFAPTALLERVRGVLDPGGVSVESFG